MMKLRITVMLLVVALSLGTANAAPAKALAPREAERVKQELVGAWRHYFQELHSLDYRFVMRYSYSDEPRERHEYRYSFLWDGWRFRLDTRFSSSKKPQRGSLAETFLTFDGAFYQELSTRVSGLRTFDFRPIPLQPTSPYQTLLPVIGGFSFALGKGDPLALETFRRSDVWQRFTRHIKRITPTSRRGRPGYWLLIEDVRGTGAQARVWVESASRFPLFVGIIRRRPLPTGIRYSFGTWEVARSMTWRSGGEARLLPLHTISRGWSRQEGKDGVKRTFAFSEEKVVAPVKINQPLDARRFTFEIPAKTLVYFNLTGSKDFSKTTIFEFDSARGNLWTQAAHERERVAANQRKLAAKPQIYDESADGESQVASALQAARPDGKRVLLHIGGNWCSWCHKLHELMISDARIAALLKQQYIVVMVDSGQRNQGLIRRLGNPTRFGVPVLVILDADGRQLCTQDTGPLETKQGGHDPQKVLAVLQRWAPKSQKN